MGFYDTAAQSLRTPNDQKTAYPRSSFVESGHRAYSPALARWMSRDPSGELGFETARNSQWVWSVWLLLSEIENTYAFLENSPYLYLDALGLTADPPWPTGPIDDLDNIGKLLDAIANWQKRLKEYLDACPKGMNDDGHFTKLNEKCESAKKLIRRLRNALDNPNIAHRELIEGSLTLLESMYDSFCPPKDRLPLPVPEPIPVPVTRPICVRCPTEEEVATGITLAGVGIALYWIISEGSRILFPPRNLIPVP